MINSQIETTEVIKALVGKIKSPITTESLIEIRNLMYSKLKVLPYNDSTKEQEKNIRWRRTADMILKDGFVYQGKACTDVTVLFIALCKAINLNTNFVKIKKEKMVHSVAEVKLSDGWYIFDVSNIKYTPEKGIITKDSTYDNWQLWQKGRDAWDLGLVDFDSMSKIT